MQDTYQSWLWEKLGGKCVNNLKRHGFDGHFVQTLKEAHDLVLDLAGDYGSFGFGGSDTIRSLGVLEVLRERGKTVYDHWDPGISKEEDREVRLLQGRCDCFLCSANAVTATGEIINVDGIGNRTSAMAFGPQRVLVIAGMNKVTSDLESGVKRIYEIAAPMRAKSLNMDTPCAQTGECTDCNSPQRICRITTILHRKPIQTDISVVLIKEHLGF